MVTTPVTLALPVGKGGNRQPPKEQGISWMIPLSSQKSHRVSSRLGRFTSLPNEGKDKVGLPFGALKMVVANCVRVLCVWCV